MEPNPDYYGELNDDWDQVVFRVIPEASTRVGELLAGGVDIINNVSPNEWERINSNDGTSVLMGESTRVYSAARAMRPPMFEYARQSTTPLTIL